MKKIKIVLVILLIFSIYVIFKVEDNNRNYYINQKINKIYELKDKNIDKYTYIKEISIVAVFKDLRQLEKYSCCADL